MKVAFIGLGIMGSRMASRLISNEIDLVVYNRSREKADLLETLGAKVATDLKAAVKGRDIVITMLSNPSAVKAASEGFLGAMSKGALWIDCSTVAPQDVQVFAESANAAQVAYLEAPVAGTKQPAANGELVFFVGGEERDMAKAASLFDKMGKKTIHMGPHGKAAAIKLVVNLMLGQSMLVYAEAIKLASALGLDEQVAQNVLLNTPVSAPFLAVLREKLGNEDRTANFPMELMLKDLHLVQSASSDKGVFLSSAALAKSIYEEAANGHEREDFSSIYHFIQNSSL